MTYLILFGFSILAWIVSTIGAGGSAMMMVPIVLLLVGAKAVPQILTLNSLVSIPYRLVLFIKHVDWSIIKWSAPGSIIGAFLGAYTFTITEPEIILLLLGIFLILYSMQDALLQNSISFEAKNWYFFPALLVATFISGLVGSVGPVLNVLYLQKNISKEAIIGTKSFDGFISNAVKLTTYSYFGSMSQEIWTYGLIAGAGGIVGITIGKKVLNKLTYEQFKKIVLFLMFVSGVIICLKGIGL